MTNCHDMKKDEIYVCESCGLELKVVKACKEAHSDNCGCHDDHGPCTFTCCGGNLKKKQV